MGNETGHKPKDTTLLLCFRELGYLIWLGVVVLFFLSLSLSFSLNPSARAEEIKREGKKKLFALQC